MRSANTTRRNGRRFIAIIHAGVLYKEMPVKYTDLRRGKIIVTKVVILGTSTTRTMVRKPEKKWVGRRTCGERAQVEAVTGSAGKIG